MNKVRYTPLQKYKYYEKRIDDPNLSESQRQYAKDFTDGFYSAVMTRNENLNKTKRIYESKLKENKVLPKLRKNAYLSGFNSVFFKGRNLTFDDL